MRLIEKLLRGFNQHCEDAVIIPESKCDTCMYIDVCEIADEFEHVEGCVFYAPIEFVGDGRD